MRLDVSRTLLGIMFISTTIVVAMMSDMLMISLSSQFATLSCQPRFFGVDCLLAQPVENSKPTLIVLLLLALLCFSWFSGKGSKSNYTPFALFMSGLLMTCATFDLIFERNAFNMSEVYSSTVNTFSYILMFTFVVMVLIKDYHPIAFLISVVGSFTIKLATFVALGLLLPSVPGAVGMFMLFATYSFAAFGLHLMMACRLFVAPR